MVGPKIFVQKQRIQDKLCTIIKPFLARLIHTLLDDGARVLVWMSFKNDIIYTFIFA